MFCTSGRVKSLKSSACLQKFPIITSRMQKIYPSYHTYKLKEFAPKMLFWIQLWGIAFTRWYHFTEYYILLIFINYKSQSIAYIILPQNDSQAQEFASTLPYKTWDFCHKSWNMNVKNQKDIVPVYNSTTNLIYLLHTLNNQVFCQIS